MDEYKFDLISYNASEMNEKSSVSGNIFQNIPDGRVHWIKVTNLNRFEEIQKLCAGFGIHHLIVQDILNTNQMAKMDSYDDCLFLVLKRMDFSIEENGVKTEHICILLKNNCIITFEENNRNNFDEVKKKIRGGKDRIKKYGADYLCYELINAIVDHYFSVMDELGDITDHIEEELISKPDKGTLQKIYFIKRKLMVLRKTVFPLREIIGNLSNGESDMLSENVKIYFHDIYDHLIQIVDSIETYQDILSNMLDIYLSSVSNKTNDTMKILTIFSTIFIPLTFLAGIYGMNFENIPELKLPYGYPLFWILSIIIASCMLLFFHKKKWF